MKNYSGAQGLRLTGKGWEIKTYLQQMLRQQGDKISLSDYLAKRYGPCRD
ncbi:Z-ring formation inhibitor MciZ [Paenibacillus lutrae]|uniref:Z-ring formation inhibitor MciZ n=1 Tax=Paenibacillus lutrae TaxID=2078573 RepID=A0A7X3FIU4_9BACL|nr:Z-ring formation inhibitor MciZ [Paenibacillus lutrae]MVP00122.1 Z-ring formation inhibitor MciZ [Paenibacillus lutrae]